VSERLSRRSPLAAVAVNWGSTTTLEAAIFDPSVDTPMDHQHRVEGGHRDDTARERRLAMGHVCLTGGRSTELSMEPAIRVAAVGKRP
jgi:hypothetical protein